MSTVTYVKSCSKRKSRKSSLRYSWRSFKRRLERTYKVNSKNIKTTQIKNLTRHRNNYMNSKTISMNFKMKKGDYKKRKI
jgi:hypothetical protein